MNKKIFVSKTMNIVVVICLLLSFELVMNSSVKEQWEGNFIY